ncbi:MAG: hypothetical protein KJO98_09085 [Rhodothermia bacterium]|nr:hypothetical protein [Rhodothermia bacterium]
MKVKPKRKIVVSGILFWYPLAGVNYQFLHYLIGLRNLGYDAYYVEDSGRWVYDPVVNGPNQDPSANVRLVSTMLKTFGFGDKWFFRTSYPGGSSYGMSESAFSKLMTEAEGLLNVTGAQWLGKDFMKCRRRVYVESDPFAYQVKVAQGNQKVIDHLDAHDCHFTFGENLGAADCEVPIERFEWKPTRQPVAMELWEDGDRPPGDQYTTVTTWKNKSKHIRFNGRTYYWSKDREFSRFVELPKRRPLQFELATNVEDDVAETLQANGWGIADAHAISRDVDSYANYIRGSRGEFTVAKDQYVKPRTGWFSDRSACYLAAGRPVITQATGFSKYLPTGSGLFAFDTLEDILSALDKVESDYKASCKAAHDIATEYFAAEKVLASLMEEAGLQ